MAQTKKRSSVKRKSLKKKSVFSKIKTAFDNSDKGLGIPKNSSLALLGALGLGVAADTAHTLYKRRQERKR